jgi:glycosyltransferase involved in cell wall biosynthesis
VTFLYCTADKVGQANHGAGAVTGNEAAALKELGPCEVWGRDELPMPGLIPGGLAPHHYEEPWGWDVVASTKRDFFVNPPRLAHFYAGTFGHTVDTLKRNGTKITYTAAAHSIEASRREHEKRDIPYNYPHLTDPELWRRYVAGYLAADVVVCPSRHSAAVMESYGCKRVEVIPHGINLPGSVAPLPRVFNVGYLGNCGAPDKGLIYLLQAWKKLNYSDAVLLIGGHDSTSPYVQWLVRTFGGGNVRLLGWVNELADFYNKISLYVQPSVSEGFGIEVLEAMAHGRMTLCSRGAGACDTVPYCGQVFSEGDPDRIVSQIEWAREEEKLLADTAQWRAEAEKYSWDKIRERYKTLWRGLLNEDPA